MFSITREFINHGDNLYEVIRRMPEGSNPVIDAWKALLSCEIVFRKDGFFYFCRIIENAVVVEDLPIVEISQDEPSDDSIPKNEHTENEIVQETPDKDGQ